MRFKRMFLFFLAGFGVRRSHFVSYLAESCFLAELGDGLIELRLLLREVLLVESEQLLALFVLLLHACKTRGQGNCASK